MREADLLVGVGDTVVDNKVLVVGVAEEREAQNMLVAFKKSVETSTSLVLEIVGLDVADQNGNTARCLNFGELGFEPSNLVARIIAVFPNKHVLGVRRLGV